MAEYVIRRVVCDIEVERARFWHYAAIAPTSSAFVGVVGVMFGKTNVVEDKSAYIDRFFVRDGYRRQGIGRALLQTVLSDLCAQEFVSAYLSVHKDNGPAIGLYQSVGMFPMAFNSGTDCYTYVVHLPMWVKTPVTQPKIEINDERKGCSDENVS